MNGIGIGTYTVHTHLMHAHIYIHTKHAHTQNKHTPRHAPLVPNEYKRGTIPVRMRARANIKCGAKLLKIRCN